MMTGAERRNQHRRAIKQKVPHRRAEPLPDNVWIAPLRRRGDSRRRRRHVARGEREHPSNEKLRGPRRERNRSTWLQHAQHFSQRNLRPGCKNMAELAQDNVKRRITKWQLLDVSLMPINIDSRDARVFPRPLQQLWREIESSDASADARCCDGNDACRTRRQARAAPRGRPLSSPNAPRRES